MVGIKLYFIWYILYIIHYSTGISQIARRKHRYLVSRLCKKHVGRVYDRGTYYTHRSDIIITIHDFKTSLYALIFICGQICIGNSVG